MPIYEFYCKDCNMIFNFFSASVNVEKRPMCPRCHKGELQRRMSSFAIPKNRGEEDNTAMPEMDEAKMEQVMSVLAEEAGHVDENNPRQAADLMRRMTEMTGLKPGPAMEEMIARVEAGEAPDQVEADMGEVLEAEDPFTLREKSSRSVKQRPPLVDDNLYYL
jgi:putative FmdB family regulatory protein